MFFRKKRYLGHIQNDKVLFDYIAFAIIFNYL
ncbi:MAG: hypothetical protein ACJAVD_000235, partial [Porticoccaceae bacterium]